MSLVLIGRVHIYVDMATDWVRLDLGRWLSVGLYKQMRGWQSPCLGRRACRLNQHDWFLHAMVPAYRATTYRCLRCGRIR
jgi:hypothetical protein